MTACPALERLAAAATDGDDDVLVHAETCARCQALLAEQLDVRALVAQLPATPLRRVRREAMAAEVMARADQLDVHGTGRPRRALAGLGILAVAALALGVWAARDRSLETASERVEGAPVAPTALHRDPALRILAAPERVALPDPIAAPDGDPVAPRIAPARVAGDAEFARDERAERDVVTLRRGELTVDAIGARPVQIVGGGTRVGIRQAKAAVVSRGGVIATVRVFAGSVEVTVDGKRVVVEAGAVWERPAPAEAADPTGASAFRDGWTALREGRHADAVAAFDRATDPVVAEDAHYWSAVASERAGDVAGAVQRYRTLIDRFPRSPRVLEARSAIERLAPDP